MSPNILRISVSFSWSPNGSREGEVSQKDDPAHPHATPGQCLQPLQEIQGVFLTKRVLGTARHMPAVPAEAGCWQTPSPEGWGQRWLLETSSRTVCLPKAGARGCLHHRKMKFGDTWKPD